MSLASHLKNLYYNSSSIISRISCDTCGIELQKNHLVKHIQVMHKTFVCQECNKKFLSKISLSRHILDLHSRDPALRKSKKRHFCPLCPKEYDYSKQLEDHIRSFHDKERNTKCKICHKREYKKRKLREWCFEPFAFFSFLSS